MQGQALVQRASGETTPFNAGDVVAAVCDMYDGPIASAIRARIGKAARELLADGFPPDTVCLASLTALRMARPHLVPTLAQELQNAKNGTHLAWEDWRRMLYAQHVEATPELANIYRLLQEGS